MGAWWWVQGRGGGSSVTSGPHSGSFPLSTCPHGLNLTALRYGLNLSLQIWGLVPILYILVPTFEGYLIFTSPNLFTQLITQGFQLCHHCSRM